MSDEEEEEESVSDEEDSVSDEEELDDMEAVDSRTLRPKAAFHL